MKEYKGWEIVKMLDEKILKVGDRFKSRTGIYEVAETSSDTLYLKLLNPITKQEIVYFQTRQ